MLEADGFEVLTADSVHAALTLLEREPPELLLVDVKMPVLDGMYFLRQVRDRQPGLPVIVMSGYATRATIREALQMGAAVFIAKPFTPDELAATVRTVLKRRQPKEGHEDEEGSGDR